MERDITTGRLLAHMGKILIAKKNAVVRGHEYFVRQADKDFHCADGFFAKDQLQKETALTNTGKEFFVLEQNFLDQYKRIKRLAQIIPRKDIGFIITETGIGKKSVVLDMGAGSGAVALLLAQFVKTVKTYDVREDHLAVVKENCKALGITNVIPALHDVYGGLPDKNADLIVLDLPEPWKVLSYTDHALKRNRFLVSYSPTIPQVMDFVAAVKSHPLLIYEKTVELLLREWEFEERKVRPMSRMMGHSGFLTFVRKV